MKNNIIAVIKQELSVILSYRVSYIIENLISIFVGVYLVANYLNNIPSPQLQLDTYIAFFLLSTELVFSWTLSTIQILDYTRERCMESILATPISISSLLLGKSIAIFLLSFPPALACAVTMFIRINVMPGISSLVLPSGLGWVIIGLSPILLFGIICLNTLLFFFFNHSQGSLLVNFGIYLLIFRLGARFNGPLGYGILVGYGLALIVVYFVIVLGLRCLSKERIVLAI